MRRICTIVPGPAHWSTFAAQSTAGVLVPGVAARSSAALTDPPSTASQVIAWNRILLRLLRMPAVQPAPVNRARRLATMHIAIADAVGAISGRFPAYRFQGSPSRYASQQAAAASAAYEVLLALYPKMKPTLDAEFARSLLTVRNGSGKTAGIAIGSDAGRAILRLRQSPPFALARPDQFRPEAPPAITSDEYASSSSEVRSVGEEGSLTRTPDQTDIARFWNAPIQDYWNEIAHAASVAHHDSVADDARVLALLNLSLADGEIALHDAKYAYRLWRPVAAISEDAATWAPLLESSSDPSYPSSHSVNSSAAAAILGREFGDRFEFAVRSGAPGAPRLFSSFSAAAREAGLSRIFAGQQFRFDHEAGQRLGRRVAEYVGAICYYPA